MSDPTTKSAPIQRYTAPVRRGFGHLCHAIVIRPSPTNPDPLTAYFSSLSPHQHSDVQAAVNYMSQQFAEEVAKTQIPAHLLQRPAAPKDESDPAHYPGNQDGDA